MPFIVHISGESMQLLSFRWMASGEKCEKVSASFKILMSKIQEIII